MQNHLFKAHLEPTEGDCAIGTTRKIAGNNDMMTENNYSATTVTNMSRMKETIRLAKAFQ